MEIPALDITFDQRELAEFERALREYPGVFRQAILAATEKTRVVLRRGIPKKLRETSTILPSVIGKAIRSKKAVLTGGGAQAEITTASRLSPLIRYQVRPDSPAAQRGVPVSERPSISYLLRRGGTQYGDQPHNDSGNLSSMFVQRMKKSGHIGVFSRIKGTHDIEQQFGPSVQWHLFADGVIDELTDKGREYFLNALRREVAAHGIR